MSESIFDDKAIKRDIVDSKEDKDSFEEEIIPKNTNSPSLIRERKVPRLEFPGKVNKKIKKSIESIVPEVTE